VKIQSRGRRRR